MDKCLDLGIWVICPAKSLLNFERSMKEVKLAGKSFMMSIIILMFIGLNCLLLIEGEIEDNKKKWIWIKIKALMKEC